MANIFPRWTNWLPLKIIFGVVILATAVTAGVTYYFTPKYTRVGYTPTQPVSFDHSLHVNQLGMDCRYCHTAVESSSVASVPSTQTCMNCHKQIQADNPKLAPVRQSAETGRPIEWVRIHQAPDFVYFNHSVHVNRGVSCVSCHGTVNEMKVVRHDQPQSMGWCLDCHRAPEEHVRPLEQVYRLDWKAQTEGKSEREAQLDIGRKLVKEWNIHPPETCEGCHR